MQCIWAETSPTSVIWVGAVAGAVLLHYRVGVFLRSRLRLRYLR
ncbi:hypothetical protein SAMN04488133_2013 [Halobellus limi]|uniref:Uncharacterized protein n=1 Tax=Halobellus limi TaxID=699433 RepID=A0A1H5ZI32_9EURY|nr:hypothetical protein SAMN04488133_2013 [Halobellus limi]